MKRKDEVEIIYQKIREYPELEIKKGIAEGLKEIRRLRFRAKKTNSQ